MVKIICTPFTAIVEATNKLIEELKDEKHDFNLEISIDGFLKDNKNYFLLNASNSIQYNFSILSEEIIYRLSIEFCKDYNEIKNKLSEYYYDILEKNKVDSD